MANKGFTLIELITALAILALLATVAVPGYQAYVQRANNSQATSDIMSLGGRIEIHRMNHQGRLPDTLDQLDYEVPLDQWGRPYAYLLIEGGTGKGGVRKDRNLNALNTDFDLYLKGPDGVIVAALTAKASHDDILRTNNGAFIGVATDY
jgi:general secretion pathway protein G